MSGDDELARLREENRALDEQLKVLVRTEQRLFRSRKELDEELSNTRALAEFALSASPSDAEDDVVARVIRLLRASFHVDCVFAFAHSRGQERGEGWDDAGRRAVLHSDAPLVSWLRASERTELLSLGAVEHVAVTAALAMAGELGLPQEPAGSSLLAVLRMASGDAERVVSVFAWKSAQLRRSVMTKPLAPRHLAFLSALANQVGRTLEAVALTGALASRGSELTLANLRLSESLGSLTEAQEKLVQAQKMEAIGRLAGGVAHDFNNLLTVILSHAELLRDDALEVGSAAEDATAILDAAARATSITRQLLSFSRQQSQRLEELELNRFVSDTTRVLGRLIGEHVHLELTLAPERLQLRFDGGQLEQVLMNLTLNARDAMPGGGTLSVRTRAVSADEAERAGVGGDEDYIALEVEDSGVGIPDELLTHVFEPFFTTKDVGRGTGLGLATVYGIVEQSGGHVFVESEVGQGTTFTVFFLASGTPTVAPPPSAPAPREGRAHGTVLVAEDEPAIRKIVRRALTAAGYDVLDAADGEQALALAATTTVDLLLTDMVMPRMTGAVLAERLKRQQPGLKVLFMSGYPLRGAASGTAAWDARAVLAKPFSATALLAAVRAALI